MAVDRFAPKLYTTLGVFLPLIAVNCVILGGALFMQERDYTFGESVVFGFGSGIGWLLHSEIVAPYLQRYGSDALKRKYLPKMAAGEMIGAIAMSEPGAGSDLQAVIDHIESYDRLLTDILGAHLAQISVQQNADMRKISAWVALAAVPTMIAGVYGMNFRYMPELEWRFGYFGVLALMAVVCGGLFRAFKRSGWL